MTEQEEGRSKAEISDEEPPQWMFEPGLFAVTEEDLLRYIKGMIRNSERRALQRALWIVLKHRFHSVPREFENRIAGERDPQRVLAAFKRALIIEKIEHFYI